MPRVVPLQLCMQGSAPVRLAKVSGFSMCNSQLTHLCKGKILSSGRVHYGFLVTTNGIVPFESVHHLRHIDFFLGRVDVWEQLTHAAVLTTAWRFCDSGKLVERKLEDLRVASKPCSDCLGFEGKLCASCFLSLPHVFNVHLGQTFAIERNQFSWSPACGSLTWSIRHCTPRSC